MSFVVQPADCRSTSPAGSGENNRWRAALIVLFLLSIHGLLAGHAFLQHNPTIDETGHVLSGLVAWKRGDVTYYYVNPPLVKAVLALPLLPTNLELPEIPALPTSEHWVDVFQEFFDTNYVRFPSLLWAARSVNVLLSVCCGWLVYYLAREMHGSTAALVALALWTFCPNALGWAGVCTVDIGAAFFALVAVVGLRTYFARPTVITAIWAGLLVGLAEIAKFTLLVLYPVAIAVWASLWWSKKELRPSCRHFIALLLVSFLVLNIGYGFQDFGRPLGEFHFQSSQLSTGKGWGNRFRDTWMANVPVPLPAAYVLGLDEQKSHADRGFVNYLCGEWKHGGWWYYYLVAALVKVPLGTWLLHGQRISKSVQR